MYKILGISALCLIGGCFVLACIGGRAAHQEIQRQEANTIPLATFTALYDGITYDETVRLIGRPGTVVSSNSIGGSTTTMYEWQAGFAASIVCQYVDGKLIAKSQVGLK